MRRNETDEILYMEALKKARYTCGPEIPLDEQVRDCFIDYVLAGYWKNLTSDDIDEISCQEMAYAVLKG